ncbi:MAG TPA: hypothetical protein PLD76_04720 [Paludibacteraceae bacterium]|nr:hypothetical protein [Paludibacteraceae bacterium]
MKKTLILAVLALMSVTVVVAQKAEVLYFKADMPCCKARACNNLEADIKAVVEKNYPKGDVVFKQVRIADEANKALVEKHQAKAQTIVIVGKKKKKKQQAIDVSEVVRGCVRSGDKTQLETKLVEAINKAIK